MLKKFSARIKTNAQIAPDVYRLELQTRTFSLEAPGQFVNISVPPYFLRRPISVCDWEEGLLTLLYKVQGKGTLAMSKKKPGHSLELLGPLGNGFALQTLQDDDVLLVGGGIGCAPLLALAKALVQQKKHVTAVLGFASQKDILLETDLAQYNVQTHIATLDGSCGTQGTVIDVIKQYGLQHRYFFACGPEGMLRALLDTMTSSGQLSFEERMGCGFGVCMGCSKETKHGSRCVCKDGPVFQKEDLIW